MHDKFIANTKTIHENKIQQQILDKKGQNDKPNLKIWEKDLQSSADEKRHKYKFIAQIKTI